MLDQPDQKSSSEASCSSISGASSGKDDDKRNDQLAGERPLPYFSSSALSMIKVGQQAEEHKDVNVVVQAVNEDFDEDTIFKEYIRTIQTEITG